MFKSKKDKSKDKKKDKGKKGKEPALHPSNENKVKTRGAQGKEIYMSYEEILARTDFTDPRVYVAMFNYTPEEGADDSSNQLSFLKGDRFVVLANLKGWYKAEKMTTGEQGHVPSNRLGRPRGLAIFRWYHGVMERQDAERRLMSGINGSFLIRESRPDSKQYSISVKMDGSSYHYRIHSEQGCYYISKDYNFPDVPSLVNYYSDKAADGLICNLSYQIPKAALSPYSCPSIEHDKFEVDRRLLLLGKKLGSGQFGDVYRGVWKNSVPVAVKTMKECDDQAAVDEFLYEAEVMKPLESKYLIALLCVCTLEPPLLIVTEFMPKGSLCDFLKNPDTVAHLSPAALLGLAHDIALGMEYLEREKILHRDLAARNVLVGAGLEFKVADFGLSKKLEGEFYKAEPGAKFPIRWTAIESLKTNKFTMKSDVWSFGIVLWELCTYGEQPYKGKNITGVLTSVEAGQRLDSPENTPAKAYELMLDCWLEVPESRPSFAKIVSISKQHFLTRAVKAEIEAAKDVLSPKGTGKNKKAAKEHAVNEAITRTDSSAGRSLPNPN